MRTTTWLTGLVAVAANAGSSVTYVDLGLTGGTSEAKTEGEEASSADRRASARSAAAAPSASTGYIKLREVLAPALYTAIATGAPDQYPNRWPVLNKPLLFLFLHQHPQHTQRGYV
jgi:hypothetical protein